MRSERIWRAPLAAMGFVLAAMALNCALALSMKPAEVSGRAAKGVPLASSTSLAVGTILPIRVNKTISKKDAQVGQSIEAEIMQDVPLANREKIHAHAHVNGTIVSIAQGEEGAGFQVSLRFDKIEDRGEIIPMATRIRTLASFLAVQAALAPLGGADSGTPAGWQNTVLVGGDVRFGDGGEVRNHQKQKVGKGVSGGVLVHVRAQPGSGCEGPVNGDDSLQALWVFSSGACGVYGMPDVHIIHDGKEPPIGVFTLSFEKSETKVDVGAGMLLRVIAPK